MFKRSAPKWRRALKTADWLVSNLPSTARFQLYTFNTRAGAAVSGTDGKWLQASSRKDVDGAIRALDSSDGRVRWTAYTGGPIMYPPAIDEGRLFVGSGDGWLAAFEAASGPLLGSRDMSFRGF